MLLVAAAFPAGAQHTAFPVLSPSQQFVEDAVTGGIMIVRQRYRLQDDKSKYWGFNNNPWFGENYTIGVKIQGGYMVSDKAVHPWNYDPNYDNYRSGGYRPEILETACRPATDSLFSELPFAGSGYREISDKKFHAIDSGFFNGVGFETDNTGGRKEGWLVWVIADKTIAEAPATALSFICYRSELTFTDGTSLYDVKGPSTQKKIIGGIYVLPVVTGVGRVTFRLAGMLHAEKEKWSVVRAVAGNSTGGFGPPKELTPAINPKDPEPVQDVPVPDDGGKKKKKRKQ